MNKQYKLIYNHDNDVYEIYDYNNDFLEEKNLRESDDEKIKVFAEYALEYFYDTEAQSLFNLIIKQKNEIENRILFIESFHDLNKNIFLKLNAKLSKYGYERVSPHFRGHGLDMDVDQKATWSWAHQLSVLFSMQDRAWDSEQHQLRPEI